MKLKNCRVCDKKKFKKLFSLGRLSYTGKFPKKLSLDIPKEEITLVMCDNCKLVQLNKNFSEKYLYGKDYHCH